MSSTAALAPNAIGEWQDWSLPVEGMTCASCASQVERSLGAVPGVVEASVNLASEAASVRAGAAVGLEALRAAVEKAGYRVGERSVQLQVEGMTCASCVSRVEKALKQVPGVVSAEVNLATETAEVRFAGRDSDLGALMSAVERAGYAARPALAAAEPRTPAKADWWPVALAAVLSAPLALQMVGLLFGEHWALNG